MQAEMSPLLDQLRDIHSAPQPAWWPPAPGWWLLAVLLSIVLFILLRKIARRWSQHRRRAVWLAALEQLNLDYERLQNSQEYLAGLNRLFRAVALRAFPETMCARLQGEDWVAFIASLMPQEFDKHRLAALASGPYAPVSGFDSAGLNESAKEWVRRYG
jgi:hypothetical protein